MKLCVWASHAKRDSGLRGVLPGEASKGTLQEAEPLHCPAQHARARAARVRQELRDLLALPPAKPCEAQDLLALPLQGFCLAPPSMSKLRARAPKILGKLPSGRHARPVSSRACRSPERGRRRFWGSSPAGAEALGGGPLGSGAYHHEEKGRLADLLKV